MNSRYTKAILISPLIPVLIISFFIPLKESYFWSIVILFCVTFTSYLGTLAFGIPTVKLLRKYGYLNLAALTLAGSILGILAFYLATFFIFRTSANYNIVTALFGAVCGFSVSLTFGLIAGITRQ